MYSDWSSDDIEKMNINLVKKIHNATDTYFCEKGMLTVYALLA